MTESLRTAGRIVLGTALVLAGVAHLTTAREAFRAQVPAWFPVDEDLTVLASGVVPLLVLWALWAGGILRRREGRPRSS